MGAGRVVGALEVRAILRVTGPLLLGRPVPMPALLRVGLSLPCVDVASSTAGVGS